MEDAPLPGMVDLTALEHYLRSDLMPEGGMGLSELDGFLTCLVVGPEMIPPHEWLPAIWGGEEPEFASEDVARTILAAIMARYNEIATCFETNAETFTPIYLEDTDGTLLTMDWVLGFLEAVSLRVDAWQPLVRDPEAELVLTPLLLFTQSEEIKAELGDAFDEAAFLANAPDLLPACAIGIHAFWKTYRQSAPRRSAQDRGRSGRRTRR